MEFLVILLSAVLGVLSPAGLVLDTIAENAIRDRLDTAEQLAVRIDNAPSYQILQGKVDKIRIAGRGLVPRPGLRIAVLELETDAIDLDREALGEEFESLTDLRSLLERPLQAGVRLVITQDDVNQALQSETVQERLRDFSIEALGRSEARQLEQYAFVNPQIQFLENNRLRFQVTLQEEDNPSEQFLIVAESGLEISSGRQLQLIEPVASINGSAVPPEFINLLTSGIGDRLDLNRLAPAGILARLLELKIDPDELALAGIVQINPATPSGN